ncbi:TIGR00299 family protein [Embleya scabrispora]|uniref:Pyridinium-3,5-bisthiocarboxylic acid mononucleotide nickel insertion protein n=1 Tax=Embleya scabrispora TaxID=159449 RepID=A0A1T3NKR4_9ACTN|nr:nickel pincer cofactor biosynthesis protein LarC [Embleya scabrispora]OPC77241.1 TIGR00299 family protein [Embleya scabrispora]
MRAAWVDASAGIAGDMLLAALVDAGAALDAVRAAVEAVVPGEVRLERTQVTRAGMRATRIEVTPSAHDHAHRTWREVRRLIEQAPLADPVRTSALAAFARLAVAEAHVHGTSPEEVHFHEVGAWDSIADVVGVCAALHDLTVTELTAGPVALGFGRVTTAHGELPVPAPAVAELAAEWQVFAGGEGELATPTGLALLTTLARECAPLPHLRLERTGVGAGGRDIPGRPNVTRVFLGTPVPATTADAAEAVVLETNIDDLDPRVWPGVLASLMEAGASDAWLTPILMKKGRPAHTLSVLCPPREVEPLRDAVFRLTTTLGVRERPVRKTELRRGWTLVDVLGDRLPVKVGHRGGRILQATPEFAPAAALAARLGLPVHVVLAAATAAAQRAALTTGAPTPRTLTPEPA